MADEVSEDGGHNGPSKAQQDGSPALGDVTHQLSLFEASEQLSADTDAAPTPPREPGSEQWLLSPKEASRAWLSSRRNVAYREHSLAQYASMIGAAADWWAGQGGGVNLLNATGPDILAFLTSRGRGVPPTLSPNTKRRYLALLGDVFQHLAETSVRSDNPVPQLFKDPELGTLDRAAPTYLDPNQEDQYIQWVREQPERSWLDKRDRALRLIFLATGVTLEEGRMLQPRHVFLGQDRPALQIAAHHKIKARRVEIANWAIEDLVAWSTERTHQAAAAGAPQLAGPYFPASTAALKRLSEDPLSSTEIYGILRPGLEHVLGPEAERFGAHTLRNTFAVRQLRAGATDKTVQQWLGLSTTFTIEALRRLIEVRHGTRVV